MADRTQRELFSDEARIQTFLKADVDEKKMQAFAGELLGKRAKSSLKEGAV